jgi:AcrR family transcriptional regulator
MGCIPRTQYPLDLPAGLVNTVHMVAPETDTRTRLLEQAREVYLEGGAANFSLREVARRVGVSAAAVYRHYDGKDALLGAVCQEGFRTFSSYLLRALAETTPAARLRAASDYYLRFAIENPHDYRVIFMSSVEDIGLRASKSGGPETSPTFQFLVDRVRECMDAHVIATGDATEIAATIWAHVHGLASLRLSGHLHSVGDDAAFAAFFRRSTDRLFQGFAA